MKKTTNRACTNCGEELHLESRNYRYTESGISNVVLQGIEVAECPRCGNSEVTIPRMAKIHWAIAKAIANSPARLTGEQLRFLRNHLGLSGEKLGRYLHTDRTKISKWERGEDPIGRATDRLIRLLVAALDNDLRPAVANIAEHLPEISDQPGTVWDLHVDPSTLQTTFVSVSRAA